MEGVLYSPLSESRDQIRLLHLFPRDLPKAASVESEEPKGEGDSQPGSTNDVLASLLTKLKGKSLEELRSSSTIDTLKDTLAKLKSLQAQNNSQPPASVQVTSSATTITEALKNIQKTFQGQENPQNLKTYSITGSLEVVSLQDTPKYIALSYVWGDETRNETILVNEIEVDITHNLAVALQHLQSKDEIVTLWVDAVCINQKDNLEKNEEVLKMKRIYENATSVLSWLGLAENESDDVLMDLIDRAGTGFLQQSSTITSLSMIDEGPEIVGRFIEANPAMKALYNTPLMAKLIESLRSLLYRQYWYRVWILQEIVAGKKVMIACGNKRTSLEAFEVVVVLLIHIFTSSTQYFVSTTNWSELSNSGIMKKLGPTPTAAPALQMLKERRWHQQPHTNGNRKLGNMLRFANMLDAADMRLRATNPRDKVYALLGLAVDADELDIIPDYGQSVEDIYTETAWKLLRSDFSILFMAQQKNRDINGESAVPSWVPDWRLDLNDSPSDCSMLDRPFRAYGKHRPIPPHLHGDDHRVLVVTGCIVDIIECAGAILRKENQSASSTPTDLASVQLLSQIENFCRRSASMDTAIYGSTNDWLSQALYRIPVADQEMGSTVTRSRRRFTEESKQRYKSLVTFLDANNNTFTSPLTVTSLAESLKEEWGSLAMYLVILYRMAERRPFMTRNGFVGVGPASLRAGDQLCIFVGAHVPYIVAEKEGGRYGLVGDAYVYGIMDGEFMEKNPEIEAFLLV